MADMLNRIAFVTGGASGIGRACALAFAAAGAVIALADINEENGNTVLSEIKALGGSGIFIKLDATIETEIAAAIDTTQRELGGLHYALNNVGRGEVGKTIETTTSDRWDWIMNTSLKSTWLAMKYELPAMAAGGGGAIVNMASIAGVSPMLTASPAYAAAKAGVIHLTRYAARAYAGKGIRVNSVAPGLTLTPTVAAWFTPEERAAVTSESQFIHRPVEPEEVAAAVMYLCSPGAAMITGMNMPVAGGNL
jgi:NAD(P)-dependent dehydrogenase (short-subunit alcohol dehydrogenase family)